MYILRNVQPKWQLVLAASFSIVALSLFAWLVVTDMIGLNNRLAETNQPSMVQMAARTYAQTH